MSAIERVEKILEDRRRLHPNDDYGIEIVWNKLTSVLSENESETINFLMNCSKDDVYLISEVFEDVSEELQSKNFIKCLRQLDKKYPELNLTSHIDLAENFISN